MLSAAAARRSELDCRYIAELDREAGGLVRVRTCGRGRDGVDFCFGEACLARIWQFWNTTVASPKMKSTVPLILQSR